MAREFAKYPRYINLNEFEEKSVMYKEYANMIQSKLGQNCLKHSENVMQGLSTIDDIHEICDSTITGIQSSRSTLSK